MKKETALKNATILAAYLLIVWGFYRFLFKLPEEIEDLLPVSDAFDCGNRIVLNLLRYRREMLFEGIPNDQDIGRVFDEDLHFLAPSVMVGRIVVRAIFFSLCGFDLIGALDPICRINRSLSSCPSAITTSSSEIVQLLVPRSYDQPSPET